MLLPLGEVMKSLVLAGLALAACSPAYAGSGPDDPSRYLQRVESPVYEADGDHQAITRRALVCIAQVVRPGLTNAPTVTSSDVEGGLIVANNAFEFTSGLMKSEARTTLTFQAKDGRFRITHTNIEQYLDASYGWTKVGTWKFSGGEKVQAAAQAISDRIADCVKTKPADNW